MINFILNLFQRFGGRNPKWREVRKIHLSIHNCCEVCGKKGSILNPLEVHHIVPVNMDKRLELDTNNLITLCREHHLLFGHLNSWKSYNQEVKEDSKLWKNKIKSRP
jgi:5-methylcytosine-specific restriction endonuclease McrA